MKLPKFKTYQIIALTIGLTILGVLFSRIEINSIAGFETSINAFDAIYPTFAAILGPIGLISAVGGRLIDALITGESLNIIVVRLLPVVAGFAYFMFINNKNKLGKYVGIIVSVVVPLGSIFVWNLNPVGREVWFYSLYWLIPVVAFFYKEKSLILRSLGSTFAHHAVGGALFIWMFNLPPSFWIALIPIVALERIIIASGITLSSYLINFLSNTMDIELSTNKEKLSNTS